jgi:hypothetical protein
LIHAAAAAPPAPGANPPNAAALYTAASVAWSEGLRAPRDQSFVRVWEWYERRGYLVPELLTRASVIDLARDLVLLTVRDKDARAVVLNAVTGLAVRDLRGERFTENMYALLTQPATHLLMRETDDHEPAPDAPVLTDEAPARTQTSESDSSRPLPNQP